MASTKHQPSKFSIRRAMGTWDEEVLEGMHTEQRHQRTTHQRRQIQFSTSARGSSFARIIDIQDLTIGVGMKMAPLS